MNKKIKGIQNQTVVIHQFYRKDHIILQIKDNKFTGKGSISINTYNY